MSGLVDVPLFDLPEPLMINHPAIAELTQTCGACPEQYEGTLRDGQAFYVRMRWGVCQLGIGRDLDAAVEDTIDGHRVSLTVDPYDTYRGLFLDQYERDRAFAWLLSRHPLAPDVPRPPD